MAAPEIPSQGRGKMCIRDSNEEIAQMADRIIRIEDGKIVGGQHVSDK